MIIEATLSNCGDFLKLYLPSVARERLHGQGNDLGYGKNDKDITMDYPQPSAFIIKVCSSQTKWWWAYYSNIYNVLKI